MSPSGPGYSIEQAQQDAKHTAAGRCSRHPVTPRLEECATCKALTIHVCAEETKE